LDKGFPCGWGRGGSWPQGLWLSVAASFQSGTLAGKGKRTLHTSFSHVARTKRFLFYFILFRRGRIKCMQSSYTKIENFKITRFKIQG
jgi:hypothetical protein